MPRRCHLGATREFSCNVRRQPLDLEVPTESGPYAASKTKAQDPQPPVTWKSEDGY